jgi:DUF1365 family protein
MSWPASGLYAGVVSHARFRPTVHKLRYRIFMMLLDLDEAPSLCRRLNLFAYNRPGLISFHDRDHLSGRGETLRHEIEAELQGAGLDLEGGPIRLLCMPRVLGFVFNPISVYYCHRRDGTLGAILYEVNNTFGQRHAYLIPVKAEDAASLQIVQSCDKTFHVSPFMDMDLRYHFKTAPPADDVSLVVDAHDAAGPMIATAFHGSRTEISDRAILKAFLAHPLLSIAVLAAIHWEAVKLLLKGLRLKPSPPAPGAPVTVVR